MHGRAVALALLAGLTLPFPAHAAERTALQERVVEAARALEKEPKLQRFSPKEREDLIAFVVGNILFIIVHELGHATISELGLPVLGREEDAADDFATVAALKLADKFSDRVLTESAKGWFLSDRRDRKQGEKLDFYDEHGMDKQRAYHIVCLMVGSDGQKYKALADQVKLPEERQQTCGGDFSNASWSWETVLKPHLRQPGDPKVTITATYEDPKGKFDIFKRAAESMQLLESIVDYAAERFSYPKPFGITMRACDDVNSWWDLKERKVIICYEMMQDFAQLYVKYGMKGDAVGAKKTAKAGKANKR